MDDEKFDLNSRIWVWFNSVLSYDNIIAHDFLNEIDGCATFADVIIGLADRCPLSDFLGDTLIGSSSLLSKIAAKAKPDPADLGRRASVAAGATIRDGVDGGGIKL